MLDRIGVDSTSRRNSFRGAVKTRRPDRHGEAGRTSITTSDSPLSWRLTSALISAASWRARARRRSRQFKHSRRPVRPAKKSKNARAGCIVTSFLALGIRIGEVKRVEAETGPGFERAAGSLVPPVFADRPMDGLTDPCERAQRLAAPEVRRG